MGIQERQKLLREERDSVAINIATALQDLAWGWFQAIRRYDNRIEIDCFPDESGKDTVTYNLTVTRKRE